MEFAAAFATIVQLIAIFKGEADGSDSKKRDAFLAWLVSHKHDDLKQFIIEHAEFDSEVTALLQRDHDAIRDDLRALNEVAVGIAERIDSLAPLAHHANGPEALSKQALQILIMFAESDAEEMVRIPLSGEKWPMLELVDDETKGSIRNFPEPRMLSDDLDSLCACGLFREGVDPNEFRTFGITRTALRFVERLNRDEIFAD